MTSSYFPGRNPLNYQGTNVTNPPQQYSFNRAPTAYDWEVYNIGDEWLDESGLPSPIWYKLVSKARQPAPADSSARAVWKQISPRSQTELSALSGDSSTLVYPNSASGAIQIRGTSGQVTVTEDVNNNRLTIALAGGGTAIDTFTPDSGTSPVVPNGSGNVTMSGSGSITSVGGTNQLTYQLTGLTNHNVLVGAGTTTITKVAPSATSGVPLISQGSSADPAFGTAVVAGGGTGATSFANVNSVILSGGTTTSALTSIASGASGTVLTSNGAGVAPTWQANTATAQVAMQVFTANGTYTPTAGMAYCIIEVLGGGGAGGGASATGVNQYSTGGGGGGGEYARALFTAATIGASQAVTIGAGGVGASAATGGSGGTTSVGTLITAGGGSGGETQININNFNAIGGAGGTGGSTTGNTGQEIRTPGQNGGLGCGFPITLAWAGGGGSSQYGSGAISSGSFSSSPGAGYGAGGKGLLNGISSSAGAGGNGSAGVVIITEFI